MQDGQATVELALALPFVVFLLAIVVEIAMIASDQIRLWHGAREAARVAAVDSDRSATLAAATRGGIEPDAIVIKPEPEFRVAGEPVTVSLVYQTRGHVPLVGRLLDVELRATAAMRLEVP